MMQNLKERKNERWVMVNKIDKDLYWKCKAKDWVDFENAEVFNGYDRCMLRLPRNGKWLEIKEQDHEAKL